MKQKQKARFGSSYFVFLVLLIYLALNLVILPKRAVWWDASAYMGIGKYLFSFGNSGFIEQSRPLVWPMVLGFLWKVKAGVFFMGVASILFGAGCIYLVYLIGMETFNKKIALTSAFLLSLSPTFFYFSSAMLTEVPSAFFGLAAVYLFIKKGYFAAGLFAGISFMTRFLQLGVFIVLFLFLVSRCAKNKNDMKKIYWVLNGFLLVVLPYLVFSHVAYGSALRPFFLQSYLTQNTGWIWHMPWWFYFYNLAKENFIFLFSVAGFYFIFKERSENKLIISSAFFLFFVFFTSIPQKEMRFAIAFMPYLCLISSYGLFEVFKKINIKNTAAIIVIFLSAVLSISHIIAVPSEKTAVNQTFQNYLELADGGEIWISSPLSAVNSNKKIDELIYYPFFNSDKKKQLESNLQDAKHILIDTCDIQCNPKDSTCPTEKKEFIEKLKENFKVVYYSKNKDCEQFIFAR